jgi:hypothetical protein
MDAGTIAVPGLFFTSLVKQQTNVDSRRQRKDAEGLGADHPDFARLAREQSWSRPPATSVEQRFRHSGWMLERLRVRHALLTAGVPAGRYDRFCNCGSDCVIEYSPSARRHRSRANYCGDRWCIPCSRARAARVLRRLQALIGDDRPLFITLTVKNIPGPLTDRLNHLVESFRRLRQQQIWKKAIAGGAAFIEVKRGTGSGHWHPHLHIVCCGGFIDQRKLSDAWLKATGDSHRVKIERAHDSTAAGSYAGKYATKGWTAEVTRDLDSCVECILALRGRRLCLTFGGWVGVDLEDDGDVPADWRRVGRLDYIYERYLAGEEWAHGVMLSLFNGVEERCILPPAPE